MPPRAVKTIQDLIFWQYAKIISQSAGYGKRQFGFVMDRFKKLSTGEINWSNSIREYVKEREKKDICIYCGKKKYLTLEHILHACMRFKQRLECLRPYVKTQCRDACIHHRVLV